MGNVINLFKDEEVSLNEKTFTRLLGGFGDDKPMFLIWQASDLLNQETREVVQNFERNHDKFEENLDYIDLKSLITENDKTNITSFFKSVSINHNKYGRSKQWLAFSFTGMMKLVKISTTKESWGIYDNFLEDYFKTKAENAHMKIGIQEQIEKLKEKKASALGMSIMSQKDEDKIKYMNLVEEYNIQILDLEKMLSKEEVVKELQSKIHMSELIENAKGNYDVGVFSKVLDVKGMGRNNLFKWMREQKILDRNNVPYQQYMKYFKVIPVVSEKGFQSSKTLLQPKGVDYIVKRLIKGNKVVTKSVEEILGELEQVE